MKLKWGVQAPEKFTGREIINKVRLKVGDTTINRFSDYEILTAVNEGIDILWRALSLHYSTLTNKVIEYSLNGAQLLPRDYNSLVRIEVFPYEDDSATKTKDKAEYGKQGAVYVEGNYIFGVGHVRLVYNYFPRDVTLVDSVIDIPVSLERDLVAITSNLITTNIEGALQRANEAAVRTSQFREIAGIPQLVAFP